MTSSLAPYTSLQQNNYTIIKTLGSGGFSITYLANNQLGKKFTIKELFLPDFARRGPNGEVIFEHLASDKLDKIKAKFKQEGQLLLGIQEQNIPHVAQVQNLFAENNTLYLVLDFIEGISLEEKIKQGGPLFFPQLLPWINDISEALSELHRHQQYHLDVKPGNIIITPQNEAVLIDFGLSKSFDPELDQHLTAMPYTERYAPPEQIGGRTAPQATMDIYALAATISFALSGQTNLDPDSSEFQQYLSGLTVEQVQTLRASLALNPSERPQSIFAFTQSLLGEVDEDRTLSPELSPAWTPKSAPVPPAPPPVTSTKDTKTGWSYIPYGIGLILMVIIIMKFWPNSPEPNNAFTDLPKNETNSATAIDSVKQERKEPVTPGKDPMQEPPETKPEKVDPVSPSPANKPAPTKTNSQFTHLWQGRIEKRGQAETHEISLRFNIESEKDADDRNLVKGYCQVYRTDRPEQSNRFPIRGYYDDLLSDLRIETSGDVNQGQPTLSYCSFSVTFYYVPSRQKIEGHFKPKTNTNVRETACKIFRTGSKIYLTRK